MITLTLLLVTVLLCAVGAIVAAVIGGGVLLVMFGDVFVFLLIVALVVKLVRKVRCRKT